MSGKAIRETLAALGVIASMVFVGLEIQQNTRALHAAAIQDLTNVVRDQVQMFVLDGEANRINLIGNQDPSQLSQEDAARYRWSVVYYWWGAQGLYRQWRLGILPDEEWTAWRGVICVNIGWPGHRAQWESLFLIPEFRSLVEECDSFQRG